MFNFIRFNHFIHHCNDVNITQTRYRTFLSHQIFHHPLSPSSFRQSLFNLYHHRFVCCSFTLYKWNNNTYFYCACIHVCGFFCSKHIIFEFHPFVERVTFVSCFIAKMHCINIPQFVYPVSTGFAFYYSQF